jgi:hypothetical protein
MGRHGGGQNIDIRDSPKGGLYMEEQKKLQEPLEETAVEESDQSKRDFITKLVTTAGAVAAAGLIAGAAGNSAQGAVIKEYKEYKEYKIGAAQYKMDKHRNGFSIVLSGPQLGESLCRSGLLGENANPNTARITIEFSY